MALDTGSSAARSTQGAGWLFITYDTAAIQMQSRQVEDQIVFLPRNV